MFSLWFRKFGDPIVYSRQRLTASVQLFGLDEQRQMVTGQTRDLSPKPLGAQTVLNTQHPVLVGREAELEKLWRCFGEAHAGRRQLIFISGEPGIGKTTLIDAFLAQVSKRENVRITSGQCVEQYGPGEAYLPLLDATTRLCRAPGGEHRLEALKQYAPSWAAHLPALIAPHKLAYLQSRVQGVSRERMLREMAEAAELFASQRSLVLGKREGSGRLRNGDAELFASQRSLVLVLEDLHWSDTATLEWLAYIARRREPARLLILGTYRSTEVAARRPQLKSVVHELQAHGLGEELPLASFTEFAVQDYLGNRFPEMTVAPELSRAIHQRTGGNPLFLTNVVNYLIEHGVIVSDTDKRIVALDMQTVERAAPQNLYYLIEQQLERLDRRSQSLLEAASIVGAEFSIAAVAAGLKEPLESLEEVCEQLARKGQFITARGVEEWPNGVISGRYSFAHALYHSVLYDRIVPVRRARLHRLIAEQKEAAYDARVGEIAGELALHYEQGRDLQRAVHYHRQAGENAIQRHAHYEAITHLTKGLELLQALPDSLEYNLQELQYQLALGVTLINTKGYAAPEVEQTYSRAWEICQQLGQTPQLFSALWGLASFYFIRAKFERGVELGTQLLTIAEHVNDPELQIEASLIAGAVHLFYRGEVEVARTHLDRVIALYDPDLHRTHTLRYGQDPGVGGRLIATVGLWCAGYLDQALQRAQEAVVFARDCVNPYDRALTYSWSAFLHQYRGEGRLLLGAGQNWTVHFLFKHRSCRVHGAGSNGRRFSNLFQSQ